MKKWLYEEQVEIEEKMESAALRVCLPSEDGTGLGEEVGALVGLFPLIERKLFTIFDFVYSLQ